MRIAFLTLSVLSLGACGLLPGGNDREVPLEGGDEDPSDFFLNNCDVTCDMDGLTLEIDAYDADSAAVEFWVRAQLVESFALTQLDDTTWVAYPDWPAGYGFDDCGADADFVCVVTAGGEEIRESR